MINALLEYALDRGLTSRPGYRNKQVRWVLAFDDTGTRFTGLLPSDRVFQAAPDLGQPELKALGARRGRGAQFLVASLATFLGWNPDDGKLPEEQDRQRTLAWLLVQAGERDEALRNLGDTILTDAFRRECLARVALAKPGPKATDLVTVRLGEHFPVEDQRWHQWWDDFRRSLKKPGGEEMVCFGTGELVEPELTHPKLTKLSGVGLSQPHAPIITFDKPAFESYGLQQAKNAAIGADTATAYVMALDRLIEDSVIFTWRRPRPHQPKTLERDFARLGGARFAYWYTGHADQRHLLERGDDLIAMIFGGPHTLDTPPDDEGQERILAEARLRQSIERIRSGALANPAVGTRFCVLALSGAGGRVMMRDFIEGTVLQLADAADAWFHDLSLVAWSGAAGRAPSLERVLTAPLPAKRPDQDYLKWVAPVGAWRQALWRSALLGGALPESAARRALEAHNKAVVRGDLTEDEKAPLARAVARLRLALVKAHLLRKQGVPMSPALDPEHPSAAYHCGRLLAVYERLQRRALGNVGAGVVQRYYGGALTNPSGVFGQLSRMAQTHLDKLDKKGFYVNTIAEIHNGIRRTTEGAASFPSALDQDDQALFALGFWHQIAFLNGRRGAEADGEDHAGGGAPDPKDEEKLEEIE